VVADRDAMLRGVAHHTVIELAPTTQNPEETEKPEITQTDGTAPAAAHAAR
jgi:hypothetical protein